MILDELTEFADATSIAAAAGTANIGDIIDLGANHRDPANAEPLYLVITIDTDVITGGSAGTVYFRLVSDATTTIATDGTATLHYQSKSYVTDDAGYDLIAGVVAVCVALPMEGPVYERYLAVQAVTVTTTTTAGKINAFLCKDPSRWQPYKSGLQ